MGFDKLSEYSIALRRSDEDLVIQTYTNSEDILVTTCKFELSNIFNLLENGNFTAIQPSLINVTSLVLSKCALTELPKCIRILHLKNLNLSNNLLTQIPSCLYGGNGLRELESLDLSHNQIIHFDIEPDCVLSLKRLKLDNNSFKSVPKWFLTFRCTNLEEFSYNQNAANHYNFLRSSDNLNFMKLRKLELRNACLLDEDLSWIKYYKMLNYIDVSNESLVTNKKHINKFGELDTLFIKPRWESMEVLKMNNLQISLFPAGIFWIESLKELHITKNSVSWLPDGLEYLVNLEILDVSNNQLVFIPKQISQLANLRILFASCNQLEEIPSLPDNIKVLDLYDNYLELIDVNNLDITFLDLEYNYINLEYNENINYTSYCNKRDTFRNTYNMQDRFNCIKIMKVQECDSDHDTHSTDSYDADNIVELSDYKYIKTEIYVENWDSEVINTATFKHPEISLSDHEYDGEKEKPPLPRLIRPTVYIDDEDWLFVDAD